jgi:hypothetical protein
LFFDREIRHELCDSNNKVFSGRRKGAHYILKVNAFLKLKVVAEGRRAANMLTLPVCFGFRRARKEPETCTILLCVLDKSR